MKNRPVGTELSHADRQTDTKKLIVAFRIYATAPKKEGLCPSSLQAIIKQSLVFIFLNLSAFFYIQWNS